MRRLVLSIVLALGITGGNAAAQETTANHWEASIGGGASFPLGDFGDVAETGWLVTPRLGNYVRPNVCLGIEYAYFSHGVKDEYLAPFELLGLDVDAGVAVHQFTGFGKFLLTPKPFAPYLRGQLGVYHSVISVEVGPLDASESETKFGLGGGGGIQFRGTGSVGGFVDAIYHAVFTDDETTTFVGVQGGITILFGAQP